MASGQVVALQSKRVPAMALASTASRTEDERRRLEECEKMLRFRDEVLSGAHPRIKVPAHLLAPKQSSESRSPASTSTAVESGPVASVPNAPKGPKSSTAKVNGSQVANNLCSFNANAQRSAGPAPNPFSTLPGLDNFPSNMSGIPTGPKAGNAARPRDASATAQFDPVLLTKSDDLIKAELQLQRQRLERALGDQLQQRRAAAKASHNDEALADFDLAEVLIKALQLVQASAPLQTDTNVAANAGGNDSDSAGDDSTFYSSKHDTPESHLTQRIPEPGEVDAAQQAREESHYEPPMVMEASPVPGPLPAVAAPFSAGPNTNAVQLQLPQGPGALPSTYNDRTRSTITGGGSMAGGGSAVAQEAANVPTEVISSQESEEASHSRDSGMGDGRQSASQLRLQSATGHLIEQAFGRRHSPILRAHNLSPVAPQPAHVSPLATCRQPPVAQQDAPPAQATPAQVAALRNDRSNGSSPESSPQGRPNKKGKKGKKRKAERMAASNAASSPFIKAEPRSPSPLTAPQYPRPVKRVRQGPRPGQEHGFDEPRVEEVVQGPSPSRYPARYRDDRGSAHGSPLGQRMRQDGQSVVVMESPRYEQHYGDDLRPVETLRYVRRVSPGAHPYPYPPREVRTFRSVSRAAVDRPFAYQDTRDPPRTVIRPGADRDRSRSPILVDDRPPIVMGPPQLPASRLVVDEFGREYIDPSARQEPVIIRRSIAPRPVYEDREDFCDAGRTTTRVIRRSVAPASAYGEPEIIYERAPLPRASSTMPGPSRYDEDVVYRGPASPAGYTTTRRVITRPEIAPEYGYYRERGYSTQAASQPGAEYYEVRATREPRPPIGEPQRDYIVRSTTVRPEVSVRPEVMRMSSMRPEPVPGEYGAPLLLDERQNMPPRRAYSVRPMAPPPPPQHPQYARQWPEYETRSAYGEQNVRTEDGGATYVDSAPRDVYR